MTVHVNIHQHTMNKKNVSGIKTVECICVYNKQNL